MIISADEFRIPRVEDVRVTKDAIRVALSDGRTVTAPVGWFPRLAHATAKERGHWRLIGRGEGIHWPLIDEDVSVEHLLAGRRSAESQESFKKWLAARGGTGTTGARKKSSSKANGRRQRRGS